MALRPLTAARGTAPISDPTFLLPSSVCVGPRYSHGPELASCGSHWSCVDQHQTFFQTTASRRFAVPTAPVLQKRSAAQRRPAKRKRGARAPAHQLCHPFWRNVEDFRVFLTHRRSPRLCPLAPADEVTVAVLCERGSPQHSHGHDGKEKEEGEKKSEAKEARLTGPAPEAARPEARGAHKDGAFVKLGHDSETRLETSQSARGVPVTAPSSSRLTSSPQEWVRAYNGTAVKAHRSETVDLLLQPVFSVVVVAVLWPEATTPLAFFLCWNSTTAGGVCDTSSARVPPPRRRTPGRSWINRGRQRYKNVYDESVDLRGPHMLRLTPLETDYTSKLLKYLDNVPDGKDLYTPATFA
ncbi:hypothetical protein HPB51_006127 [Rhipicephalus microplus]|uniref:Uncharacterized protein n=1 Tax=Rhipicephalus microplus TaxID=6941 RepID=A0A9J6ER34_RHIMP|nr:hypothetical protein HPB51_006127 [Rhipicephalus microplus]